MNQKKLIVGEDMICPITKRHCDDECCPVGASCNLSSDVFSDNSEMVSIQRKPTAVWSDWKTELAEMKNCPQRQDGMKDQLKDLYAFACKLGFYDAADFINQYRK